MLMLLDEWLQCMHSEVSSVDTPANTANYVRAAPAPAY